MADDQKWTAARVLQILIPTVSATIAVVSLLIGIAARKKELTCTFLASVKLVSIDAGGVTPDVRIEVRQEKIQSLLKLTFSIRNTGSAAIKGEDVKEEVGLQFPTGVNLLNAAVEKTSPQQFNFAAKLLPEKSEVLLDFLLLNPGDEAIVSVYTYNSDLRQPAFVGRIVDVPKLVYQDAGSSANEAALPYIRSHALRSVFRWVLAILYSSITAFLVGVWVAATFEFLFKFLPWKRKWENKFLDVVREYEQGREKERKDFDRKMAEIRKRLPADVKTGFASIEERNEREEAVQALIGREGVYTHYVPDELRKLFQARSVPARPSPMFETVLGWFGASLALLGIASLTAFTCLLAYSGLRG